MFYYGMNNTITESKSISNMESNNKKNEELNKMRRLRESADRSMKQFPKFMNKVKTYFIVEGMMFTIDQAMKEETNISYDRNICRNILENYVNDHNPELVLKAMEEKTMYLSSMAKVIREEVEAVEEGCNKADSDTFNIKTSTNTDFFDKLNMMTNDQLSKSIHNSVLKATQDFVEGVTKDKENMKETAEKIKAKVDELKTDDEQVKESYYRAYENRIKTSRKERPKNLLETVVVSLSENAHRDEVLKEAFINEGKTNLDKIMNVATGVYVTLEAMNSSRLQVMDKRIFNEVLTSLNKK
jgi:hypothetical protein|uniref:Uncharacterized protein n=1 Tax=Myoviridae sp. ctcyQ27 TaxID=2825139 RepID=A0A8S5UFC8_9CAUD|nr:MAG TPA: hypothetical protein [Myoviridae sp. ctcyQ27]